MSILIVLTSNDKMGDSGKATGVWLEEFLAPYYIFTDRGIHVELATPKGGAVPIDPASIAAIEDTALFKRYKNDTQLQQLLQDTVMLKKTFATGHDAIFYPGGHGPLWDLRYDEYSKKLIQDFWNTGKIVAAVCHAGCVLLDVNTPDGAPLVKDKKLTCFSNEEETAVACEDIVPYLVETELRHQSAQFSKAGNWEAHVVIDGKLITGQNPASSEKVALALVEMLNR